jgi:phosphoadenosine phosphosulfate reductase
VNRGDQESDQESVQEEDEEDEEAQWQEGEEGKDGRAGVNAEEGRAWAQPQHLSGDSSRQGSEEGRQDRQQVTSLADAKRLLRSVHGSADKILVGLSGGKDSLVTLDLCVREFGASSVVCFFMYFVKGLRCVETTIRWVEQHYGVAVHYLPHWCLGLAYKYATYMPHRHGADGWRDMRMTDVEQVARQKTSVDWLAYGHRMCDSIERVGMLKKLGGIDRAVRRVYPLWKWNEAAVFAYLRQHRIPTPPRLTILRRSSSGVSFEIDVLLAIKQRYPDDFDRILEVFPFAGAKLARHELQKTSWKQKTFIDKFRTSLRGR